MIVTMQGACLSSSLPQFNYKAMLSQIRKAPTRVLDMIGCPHHCSSHNFRSPLACTSGLVETIFLILEDEDLTIGTKVACSSRADFPPHAYLRTWRVLSVLLARFCLSRLAPYAHQPCGYLVSDLVKCLQADELQMCTCCAGNSMCQKYIRESEGITLIVAAMSTAISGRRPGQSVDAEQSLAAVMDEDEHAFGYDRADVPDEVRWACLSLLAEAALAIAGRSKQPGHISPCASNR
eukprot:3411322-Amphidinium_carterae.2